jgi:hypothetical protein
LFCTPVCESNPNWLEEYFREPAVLDETRSDFETSSDEPEDVLDQESIDDGDMYRNGCTYVRRIDTTTDEKYGPNVEPGRDPYSRNRPAASAWHIECTDLELSIAAVSQTFYAIRFVHPALYSNPTIAAAIRKNYI